MASRATAKRGALALAVLATLLGGGAAYFYFFLIAPSPQAHRHVPPGTTAAVRVDAVDLLTFRPVREHLWPLVLEDGGEPSSDESRRLRRLAELTGVRIPQDLRELVVASTDGLRWVALAGGTIEAGRFVDGLETLFAEEQVKGWSERKGLFVHRTGAAIGQAEDGTLAFGTHEDIVRAALPEREDNAPLPLATDAALTFFVASEAGESLPALPGLDLVRSVERVEGTFTLSTEPQLALALVPRGDVDAAKLAGDLEGALAKAKLMTLLVKDDRFGAKGALVEAKVTVDGPRVRVEAPWSYEALDGGVEALADLLRARAAIE